MKRILMLLILMSFCKGFFSLEIVYVKEIDVDNSGFSRNGFCDNAQIIIYGQTSLDKNEAINVQDGTITSLDYYEGRFTPLNRFGYFAERDKFFRSQNILFSLVYGSKPISKEVITNLTGSNRTSSNFSGDEWTTHLYGNVSIQESDLKITWEYPYSGIAFFSDENKMVSMINENVPKFAKYKPQKSR